MSSSAEVDYRLPTNVKPTAYHVTVRTDLVDSKFDGIVVIDLDVKKDTSKLVFNAANLRLSNITLTISGAKSSSFTPASIDFDKTMERCTLGFPESVPAGAKAHLKIAYEGELTDALMGYYKSVSGEGEVYALTQFEPTAARRVFPCWDEPLLKATFSVTMISRADTVSLSNTTAESEDIFDPNAGKSDDTVAWLSEKLASLGVTQGESEKWKITRFAESPPMSTYLVAFANGRFEYVESSYTSPLSGKTRPLRAYATKDMVDKLQFALYVKEKALPLYEKVFDIEYPLPKLDTLVAHDFDSGAMENWGLITGRTSCFALDPNSEDLRTKKEIANTQCHEVAHMWFGNIATMEWWDNLYLNEGEPIMGEVIILGEIFPEWNLHSAFITAHHKYALDVDDNLSSHPVEVECPDANMVNQIFDGLSYSKAASVLRMLSSYVGEEKFLKGVSIYLKKHLFANSVTRDLWEGIQEASGIDVPKMMDNWVKKIGFPVLTVTETSTGIHIHQDRFLGTGPAQPKDNETIWTVPLSLLTVDGKGNVVINKDEVLDQREKSISLDVNKPWKINAGTVTFCRVLYRPDRLVAIGREAAKASSPFSIEDRMGLVDDAFALSKAGYSEVSSALALTDVLRNESEYLVWESIRRNLALIRSVWWEDTNIANLIEGFLAELFTPLVDKLGYEYSSQDSADTRELRTLAIEGATSGKSPKVVEELRSRFSHYMITGDDSKIPPELQIVTYAVAVREGGRAEWEGVKKIALQPKNPATGIAARRALARTQDLDIAKDTWKFMMEDVRTQDLYYMVGTLGVNPSTRRFLAEQFKADYELLDKKFEGNYGFQDIVAISFRNLSADKDYEETAQFFKDRNTEKYKMKLDQTLEDIQVRSAWVKRSTEDIRKWFTSRKSAL
ncbi:leucyl aminopeptidase [Fomitopsis serialis]|uniref:leucyl aminopeptidase n=1 Tax=Fomitopsis serialis TaxID=139415 RepID=UPI002008BEC3|nr:leucyl aminopeptidase [Neoantrodia serialis]KAH9921040.1 leucyl aminopeptidase [Neoantrodia serialis]